jgi:hypothetical protein
VALVILGHLTLPHTEEVEEVAYPQDIVRLFFLVQGDLVVVVQVEFH